MVSDIFDHVLIVRYSSIFNRVNLVVNELYIDNSKRKMKKLLNVTVENNIMTASKCDHAMNQLFGFVNNVKKSSEEFYNFDKAKNSCFKIEKAKELNFVLKLIFTRSHGKSSAERGFSVNNLILENNMKAE